MEPEAVVRHPYCVTAMTQPSGVPGPAAEAAATAFEEFYRPSYARMVAVAMATTRDRALAEDMTQDAFAQLWRQWDRVDAPKAWLRKAVVSNCLDALRTEVAETRSCDGSHLAGHRHTCRRRVRRPTQWPDLTASASP